MPQTIMELDRWKARLRAQPDDAAEELAAAIAAGSELTPEIEDLAWRAVADRAPSERLAGCILARIRPGAALDEPLVDLAREHRIRSRGRLRMVAREAVETHVFDPEERERIGADPLRLVEVGFVTRRRRREAAALWALEHERMGDEPGAGEPETALARLGLRYRLGRSLHRLEDAAPDACAVMEATIALLDALRGAGGAGLPPELRDTYTRLAFHSREWLGLRRYELGLHHEAERRFREAAAIAPAPDLELAVLVYAANALIARGEREEGRRLLAAVSERAARLE